MPRTRDAENTRQRIFEAATAEFASHGIAGARIDRIAAAAEANKQLIYAYFGNKRQLFDAVVSEHVTRFVEMVPFRADRLAEFAGAAFDYFVAHPEVMHLASWHSLESGKDEHRIPAIEQAIRSRARLLAAAQKAGVIHSVIAADELLALVTRIASTWAVGTPERTPRGSSAGAMARRRAAVVEAVSRLCARG